MHGNDLRAIHGVTRLGACPLRGVPTGTRRKCELLNNSVKILESSMKTGISISIELSHFIYCLTTQCAYFSSLAC